MIGYYQTLIITIKHEIGDRVFLYPVALILMKSKATNAYIMTGNDVIKKLFEIHRILLFLII